MPDRNAFFNEFYGLAQWISGQIGGVDPNVILGIFGSESNFGNLNSPGAYSLTGEIYAGQPGSFPQTFRSSNGAPVTLAMFPTPEAAAQSFVNNINSATYRGATNQFRENGDSIAFLKNIANPYNTTDPNSNARWVNLVADLSQQSAKATGTGIDAAPRPNPPTIVQRVIETVRPNPPVARSPDGRTVAEIRADPDYRSYDERIWFLNQQGKTVDFLGNVVPLATAGGGRTGIRIFPVNSTPTPDVIERDELPTAPVGIHIETMSPISSANQVAQEQYVDNYNRAYAGAMANYYESVHINPPNIYTVAPNGMIQAPVGNLATAYSGSANPGLNGIDFPQLQGDLVPNFTQT